jgi:phage terminase large subunit-like protein
MIRGWIHNALIFGIEAHRDQVAMSDEAVLEMATYLSANPTASFQDYLSMRLYRSTMFGEKSIYEN